MSRGDSTPHILIFDSGVGGLSITQSVLEQHPYCSITYASDNAAFPYGTMPEDLLIERVDIVLQQLQVMTAADIIIVACNTASTVALPKIRERFELPIIGVVPAIKPAAKLSKTKTIGLLATPGTISRPYTQGLIEEFASNCSIIPVGSSELVYLAEQKLRGITISSKQLKPIIGAFLPSSTIDIDTIVLACTHFPLLKTELQKSLPNISCWVDSGEAIARRVGFWLNELELLLPGNKKPGNKKSDNEKSVNKKPDNQKSVNTKTVNNAPLLTSIFTAQQPEIKQLRPTLKARGFDLVKFMEVN